MESKEDEVIDIESLTIGEARKLAALFGGGAAPAREPELHPERLGRVVLVRSRGSGVWIGTLIGRANGGATVSLRDARRLWSWTGAAECSALAQHGPSGGRIGVPSAPVIHEVVEEHEATPEAIAAVAGVPPWRQ